MATQPSHRLGLEEALAIGIVHQVVEGLRHEVHELRQINRMLDQDLRAARQEIRALREERNRRS